MNKSEYTHVLKISRKNIEKPRASSNLSKMAYGDMDETRIKHFSRSWAINCRECDNE